MRDEFLRKGLKPTTETQMVLPIIIGTGVTIVALVARSGLRAWEAYKLLSPSIIAKMNNVPLARRVYPHNGRFQQELLNEQLRARLERYRGGFDSKMTESEALLILNISPAEIASLDDKMLKRKHRRIMLQNHPDKGGSPYLAMKLNEAREVLEHSVMLRGR